MQFQMVDTKACYMIDACSKPLLALANATLFQIWTNIVNISCYCSMIDCYCVQVAEVGQIAYLRSQINAIWQPLTGSQTLTDDQYSGTWGNAWYALGDDAYTAAGNKSNGYDWRARRDAYLKAANYFFTGRSGQAMPACHFACLSCMCNSCHPWQHVTSS